MRRPPATVGGETRGVVTSWNKTAGRPPPRAPGRGAVLSFGFALAVVVGGPRAILAAVIETYVGGGNGDGSLAINATIDPRGLIAVGSASAPDLYIADGGNRVRRVDGASGVIETIAGNGVRGYGGDGGSAQNASLSFPLDVARDSAGNLYIADTQNNRVRKVTPNGQIATLAGTGAFAFGGDGGLATQAALSNPYAVAVASDGSVYIADFGNNRIRRVGPPGCAPSTCVITTVVGNGARDFSGDGGPALSASLKNPADVSFDGAGNMLIADWGNHRIRQVTNGIINTVAGGGSSPGSIGDGGPATSAVLLFPTQVAADRAGNLFIADSQQRRIRMVQASNQLIHTIAGTGAPASTSGDGGVAVAAALYPTYGVAATAAGNVWLTQTAGVARSINNRVRRVTNGIITSAVGGGLGDGGAAYDARVEPGGGQATLGQGLIPDLYFADVGNNVARYVTGATGDIFTLAGTGAVGYSGDGGPAQAATLDSPNDVAVDASGTVYVADTGNNAVRRIRNGIIDTVAGDGRRGSAGDGGAATAAQLNSPTGVAVDASGRLYIADNGNNRIRRVSNGIITTVAGNGTYGFGGDGGPATGASLRTPWDVAIAADGTMFIADTWNYRVRAVDPSGIITTYAGQGYSGFSGDGGPALLAWFYVPTALSLDDHRRLFVADALNQRVRMIDNSPLHLITTIAGNGAHGFSGDGGPATAASISDPSGVAVDPRGETLFVSSEFDGRVRVVSFAGATPTPTIAATPTRTRTPIPQSWAIHGAVTYYSNQQVVPSVDVHLTGSFGATAQTNAQGQYTAALPPGTWSIEPAKTGAAGIGVSALDAVFVLQTLAGLRSFTYQQRLACDVTGDGTISSLDAAYILQWGAGLVAQFPAARLCGSDWLFYPKPTPAPNQTIVLPVLLGGICQQGAILFTPLTGAADGQDFAAIVLGDCTGNWTTAAAAHLRQRASGAAVVHAGVPRQGPGTRFTIPIYVESPVPFHAVNLRLRYDAAATFVAAYARGESGGAMISTRAGNGQLAIGFANAAPIDGGHGSILLLRFRGANPAPVLDGALIDEQPARVVTLRPPR